MPTEYYIKDRELIFVAFDRSVKCLCGSIKDWTQYTVISISEETTGIIIYQKMGRYAMCHVSNIVESIILF